MVFQLHLAQFSHLTFEECHSELCGVFGIPRNGIFFHLINFRFRHIGRGGNFENLSSGRNMTPFSVNESARISIIT